MYRQIPLALVIIAMLFACSKIPASQENDIEKLLKKMGLFSVARTNAPDFKLPDLEGKEISPRTIEGKIGLINFWATWCSPCRAEMPSMQRLFEKLHSRGLEILAISIDAQGASVVEPFMRKHKLGYSALLDPNGAVSQNYHVRGIPTSFIIDEKGRFVAGVAGARQWDSADAVALFEVLLARRMKPPLVVQEPCSSPETATC